MKEFKIDDEPKVNTGFTNPDGYFDLFSQRMLTQLPKDETILISIFGTRKRWFFAVAAVLVVMLSTSLYVNSIKSSCELNSEELENYITYQSSITEDEIANLLETEDIENIKIDLNLQTKDLEEIILTNTELEKHLIN